MSNNEWTQTELATMRERWPHGGAKACIGYVKRHRTLEAIKRKGNLIGLTSADILPEYRNTGARAAWSDEDDKRLSELYPKLGTDACLEHFPGRSRPAIRNRVTVLGLRLLPQTLERMTVKRFGMEMTLAPKRNKQDDNVSQFLRSRW